MKLLEQLKDKGIAWVEITFSGEGDSGCIEGIYYLDANNQLVQTRELEEDLVKLADAIFDNHYISFDNDGCFGEIRLDVESGKINLVINNRYVHYESDYHEENVRAYLEEEEEDAA